ncbi:UNVERIFIED_CONTAM: putative membrane protein YphA (DoxX/SURF4 family) [Brevibacillus sp. OAP136]
MGIALIVIQLVLAAMFVFSSSVKFRRTPMMVEHWEAYRYPPGLMTVVGAIELIAALCMVAGIWDAAIAKGAAAVLIMLMVGAIHAHLFRARHPLVMASNAGVMLALAVIVLLLKNTPL